MECVQSGEPDWFSAGKTYDSEIREGDTCICGDNYVSDLNDYDWYEISKRIDGLWFLIGFGQLVLFREIN